MPAYVSTMAYDPPTPATLRIRYPAFASVADETVQYWLTDAERVVTTEWAEADYAPALMALAAHNMTITPGILIGSDASVPAGVTRFKSGSFEVSMSDAAANLAASGGYRATIYGQEFLAIQRRNFAGPFLVGRPAC